MGNMVTNFGAKFNFDGLHIDKVLGNWKSDNNKNMKNKNTWVRFPSPKSIVL